MATPRTIIFPSKNNRTYRSGYIKLTAYGSEFMQSDVEGNTASVVERLKQTARKAPKDFEGTDSLAYLRNAITNMKVERKKQSGEIKFAAILPLPLAIQDNVSVEWASTNSAFIDGAYGKIKRAGVGEASNRELFRAGAKMIDKTTGTTISSDKLGGALDWLESHGVGSGHNSITEAIITGATSMSASVAQSPAAQAYLNPGRATAQILGLKSDSSILDFHREAAALSGVRQVIFDPGYWQSFQGVQPRNFTLTWDIIPENHQDALAGLELCARIKEFSLPVSVSGVELMSPCYWWLDWSNELLAAQTLYANLVIKNITVDYAQNGEWNGASTPKMFRISISFEEAKSPTADIYKVGDVFIPVSVATSGGAGGSSSTKSRGGLKAGSASGGAGGSGGGLLGAVAKLGSSGSSGSLGGLGNLGGLGGALGGVLGNAGSAVSGALSNAISGVQKLAGSAVGGLVGSVGDKLGDAAGGLVGSVFGDKVGNIINDVVDGAAGAAGAAIRDAAKTGNFKDLGNKIKSNALDAAGAVAGAAVGGVVEEVTKPIRDKIGEVTDAVTETIGKAAETAGTAISETIDNIAGPKDPKDPKDPKKPKP